MSELEKLERAKLYLDKLAVGIDPISDSEVKTDSVLNNVRLSRCFSYVSDILRQVIENGGEIHPDGQPEALPFAAEQRAQISFSKEPLSITRFMEPLNLQVHVAKKLPATAASSWLTSHGFLAEVVDEGGIKTKMPTPEGQRIGLSLETRQSPRGDYSVVLYNEEAQHFIIDNLEDILQSYREKAQKSSAE